MMKMMKLQATALYLVLLSVILVDFAVQARHCVPPCESDERCIAGQARERRLRHHNNNICVPHRCLHHTRRGRCHSFGRFSFDRATMSCVPMNIGVCYESGNLFSSEENCELACLPFYRR